MADTFPNGYFPAGYFADGYFGEGGNTEGRIRATLSGSSTLSASISSQTINNVIEVYWPYSGPDRHSESERHRAALVSALIEQARQRGKEWVEANKPKVKRTMRRAIERELKAQGLLTTEIMGQVAPMLSDALESLPLLDFDALQMQLRQFDEIIWQQAERLAEEYRLAMLQDDEDALILIMAAA